MSLRYGGNLMRHRCEGMGRGDGGINGEHSVIPLKLQSAPHHILRKGLVCFLTGFGEFAGVGAS